MPEKMTAIGRSVFQKCISLTSIDVPEGISELDSNVFSGCTALKNVVIYTDDAKFSGQILSGVTDLPEVRCYPDSTADAYLTKNYPAITKIYFDSKVDDVKALFSAVPAIDMVTAADREAIDAALDAYDALSDEDKENFSYVQYNRIKNAQKKLADMDAAEKNKPVDEVKALIAAEKKAFKAKKPTIKSLKKGTKKVTVRWTYVKGAAGYQIVYGTNKSVTKNKKTVTVTKGTAVTKTVKKLSKDRFYYPGWYSSKEFTSASFTDEYKGGDTTEGARSGSTELFTEGMVPMAGRHRRAVSARLCMCCRMHKCCQNNEKQKPGCCNN